MKFLKGKLGESKATPHPLFPSLRPCTEFKGYWVSYSIMWGFIEKAVTDLTELVAPITNNNQLYLAIQNSRNDEAKFLIDMNNAEFNIHGLMANCGHGALHLACRFNNKEVLDALTNKGVSIFLLDSVGNTALHYAAKYGHIEMCKYLVDQGATKQVITKNKEGRTPYESAESHKVRQYLLPLQYKVEPEANAAAAVAGGCDISNQWGGSQNNQYAASIQENISHAVQEPPAPPPVAPQGVDYSSGNPYASSHSSLQHPTYAEYSNPFAQQAQQALVTPQQHQSAPTMSTSSTSSNSCANSTTESAKSTTIPAEPKTLSSKPEVVSEPVVEALEPVVTVPMGSAPSDIKATEPAASQGSFTGSANANFAVPAAVSIPQSTPLASVPTSAPVLPRASIPVKEAPPAAATNVPGLGQGGPYAINARPVIISNSPLKPPLTVTPAPAPAAHSSAMPPSQNDNVAVPAQTTSAPPIPNPPPAVGAGLGEHVLGQGSGDSRFINKKGHGVTGGKNRVVADGFHSSSNDPVLQARYGHIIEHKVLPPPPIFSSGSTGPSPGAPPTGGPAPPLYAHAGSGTAFRGYGTGSNSNLSQAGTGPPLPSHVPRATSAFGASVPTASAAPPPRPLFVPATIGSSTAPKCVYKDSQDVGDTNSATEGKVVF